MKRQLSNKRVLVTGVSSGIGYHLALQLASAGSRVLGVARREDRLQSLLALYSSTRHTTTGALATLRCDITNEQDRQQVAHWITEHWGGLDGIIHNAGAGAIGPFMESTPQRLRSIMEVDFFAPIELTRELFPHLCHGLEPFIAIVGSVLSHVGVPDKSEYCAAKFGLRGWSQSVRCEWKKKGIDVLMMSPSTTKSEFFQSLIETDPNQSSRSYGAMVPEQVANTILRSIERNRRETVISLGGKGLVLASRWFPSWLERFL